MQEITFLYQKSSVEKKKSEAHRHAQKNFYEPETDGLCNGGLPVS